MFTHFNAAQPKNWRESYNNQITNQDYKGSFEFVNHPIPLNIVKNSVARWE
jgi:hypothetical protein